MVTTIADRTAYAKAGFSVTVPETTFADVDVGDSLTLSAARADGSPLPVWLVFDGSTRQFHGTPATTDAGPVEVRLMAADSGTPSLTAETTFTVTVASNPWQNPQIPMDVDGQDGVTPLDVLIIINDINLHGDAGLARSSARPRRSASLLGCHGRWRR